MTAVAMATLRDSAAASGLEANEGMCSLRVAAAMRAGERPSLSLPIRINAREVSRAAERMSSPSRAVA